MIVEMKAPSVIPSPCIFYIILLVFLREKKYLN